MNRYEESIKPSYLLSGKGRRSSFMATLTSENNKAISFSEALSVFLNRLPSRSSDIVNARFGVGGNRQKTLEEIGRTYRITRERIRQIVGGALGCIASERNHPLFVHVADHIRSTLAEKSGIMTTEELLEKLTAGKNDDRGALLVFLECLPFVKEEKATKEREDVYVLESFSAAEWKNTRDVVKEILERSDTAFEGKALFAAVKEKGLTLSEKTFFDFLTVSKEIKQNVFGKWGLSSSSDIRPRGTREKAYLILKTSGKPLHFREIAALIDNYGLQSKKGKSHPQTVHNELIKDNRFVLVGRGIYALSEWGYKRGTVKEVIAEILAAAETPLSREEVLDRVLKIRQVKKSTVIINLNAFFSKAGKNAYVLKK